MTNVATSDRESSANIQSQGKHSHPLTRTKPNANAPAECLSPTTNYRHRLISQIPSRFVLLVLPLELPNPDHVASRLEGIADHGVVGEFFLRLLEESEGGLGIAVAEGIVTLAVAGIVQGRIEDDVACGRVRLRMSCRPRVHGRGVARAFVEKRSRVSEALQAEAGAARVAQSFEAESPPVPSPFRP